MPYRQLKSPNLTPVIYSGNTKLTSWAGWCLAYVEVAFGTPRHYPSAWQGWLNARKRHANSVFPQGVYFPIWFEHSGSYGSPPKYDNWGHVAIARVNANGSMEIWSSPASAKAAPDTYDSIEAVEKTYSSRYVGWSEDLAETPVIEYQEQGGSNTMTPDQVFDHCFITQANRWPNDQERQWWRESGLAPYTWVQTRGHFPMKEERDAALAQVESLNSQNQSLNSTVGILEAQLTQAEKGAEEAQQALREAEAEFKAQAHTIDEMTKTINRQKQEAEKAAQTMAMLKEAAKGSDAVAALSPIELIRIAIKRWLGGE